jgi:hypothetical protein
MNEPVLDDTLIGEEWMALRRIAHDADAAIPRSVRTRLVALGLIRNEHGPLLTLTERGRRIIETPDL